MPTHLGIYIKITKRETLSIYRTNSRLKMLAAINSDKHRSISVPLSFLPEGNYRFDLYTDSSERPQTGIQMQNITCKEKDTLQIELIPNGGCAAFIGTAGKP